MNKNIKFIKMTAQGNNYIYLDNRDFRYEEIDFSGLSKAISCVRFGIGSDGLVVLEDDEDALCLMRIFNSDGSQAKMCGNALRCVAYLMAEEGHINPIRINTLSGIRIAEVDIKTKNVKVNMGLPKFIEQYESDNILGNIVDIGNQHLIIHNNFALTRKEFLEIAEKLQTSSVFSDGINIELIDILDRKRIQAIVYERGSGLTYACGSGASALFWDCYINGLVDDSVIIKLDGGDIKVSCENNNVILEGEVKHIGSGTFYWR